MIDQLTFILIYCPSQKCVVLCAADTSDRIKEPHDTGSSDAAHLRICSACRQPPGAKGWDRAHAVTTVPCSHGSHPCANSPPQHPEHGAAIPTAAAGCRLLSQPSCFPLGSCFPSPVSGGIKQRASNPGEKNETSFPGSGAFPPLGSAAPWSVLIKQTVLKDTLK